MIKTRLCGTINSCCSEGLDCGDIDYGVDRVIRYLRADLSRQSAELERYKKALGLAADDTSQCPDSNTINCPNENVVIFKDALCIECRKKYWLEKAAE